MPLEPRQVLDVEPPRLPLQLLRREEPAAHPISHTALRWQEKKITTHCWYVPGR